MEGWQADPSGLHQERYHDGTTWTARVRDRGIENEDARGLDGLGIVPAPGAPGAPSASGATSASGDGPRFGRVGGGAAEAGRWTPPPAATASRPGAPVGPAAPASPASPLAPPRPSLPPGAAPGGPLPSSGAGEPPWPATPPSAGAAPPPPVGAAPPPITFESAPTVGGPPVGGAPLGAAAAGAAGVAAKGSGKGLLIGAIVALVVVVIGGAVVYVVANREPTRSVEAFCKTMKSEQKRIRGNLDENVQAAGESGDEFAEAFLTLGASMEALGELETYFTKLSKVAPSEIQAEAELVASKIGEVTKAPELSLEGLASSMMTAMELSGPLNTLNEFAVDNCGQSI